MAGLCIAPPHEQIPSGSKTIVIHPGSETLRIGRATDYAPKEVPMALARRRRTPCPSSDCPSTSTGGKGKKRERREDGAESMEIDGAEQLSDEVKTCLRSLHTLGWHSLNRELSIPDQ